MGINLIGHLNASSGLGNTARLFARALTQRGVDIVGLDIDSVGNPKTTSTADLNVVQRVEDLPFKTNLIIVSILLLPSLWCRRLPVLISPQFTNIGMVFWELPEIPPAWIPALEIFDSIVVCSQYVRSAVELSVPDVPTIFAEHPLERIDSLSKGRIHRDNFSIKQSDIVFGSSFDLRSDFSRKNSMGVLEAFQRAFPNVPNARLLVKASGQPTDGKIHPIAKKILAESNKDSRITFVDRTMDYSEVMSLYQLCDVFVSLHRAEGLGLGPMEAMLMGKLVIATGYSGNTTYMTEQNSVLVEYSLVKPTNMAWQFRRSFAGARAVWAEPNMESAISALRYAFTSPDLRSKLGSRARNDILARQETAWNADNLVSILDRKSSTEKIRRRVVLQRKIKVNEYLDPTLLMMNIKSLYGKLNKRDH